jgi:hypothetical protein
LGRAEITHPFHPLRGQRFPILKIRRVSGVKTLILQGSSLGTFAVPQEWTDKGIPSPYGNPQVNAPILDFQCLLALNEILDKFDHNKQKKS